MCIVQGELRSTNDRQEYKITRGARGISADVYNNGDLGIGNVGRYKLRGHKNATAVCIGNDCNDLEVLRQSDINPENVSKNITKFKVTVVISRC